MPSSPAPAATVFPDGLATAFAPMAGPGAPRAPIAADPAATAEGPLVRLPDAVIDGAAVPTFGTADPA